MGIKPITKETKPAMVIENTIFDEEEEEDVHIDETMEDEDDNLEEKQNEIEIGVPLITGLKVFIEKSSIYTYKNTKYPNIKRKYIS